MGKFKCKQIIKSLLTIVIALCVFAGMTPLVSDYEVSAATTTPAAISKTKVTMYVGTSTTLKITGTKSKVKWSSSKAKVAKISSKGKVTAKKAGTATIKAKVGKKTYKCKVTVKKAPKLSKTTATIYAGKSTTLKISGYKIGKATWSSSKSSVAKVSGSGKVTGLKKGTAYIYAKIGGKKLKCKVTVKTIAVQYVDLKPVYIDLYVGQTYTYKKPIVTPSNATYSGIKWTTDDPCITIKDGKVTAITSGSATVNAIIGGKSDYSFVMVKSESLSLNRESYYMYVGETQTIRATIDPGVVPGKKIKWRSTDPSIATVDQNGLVTGISKGDVKIYAGIDGREWYQSINIKAPKVNIDPYSKTLYVGDTYDVEYEIDQGVADNPVVWSSDDENIAIVDKNGRVTAIGEGKTTIRVSCAGGTDSFTITVKNMEATSISITPSATMPIGATFPVSISVSPSNYPMSSIKWTSDDESIASVVDGVVTAHYPGTTYIRAYAGSKSDYCKVTVTGVKVTSLVFDKSAATKYPGEVVQINATISPSNATIKNITWKSSNEAVATVSNGLVTCHSVGKATITGTVDGKSATFTMNVVEKPTVLNIGEVWTVEDNFRFVVNSVVQHDKCNTIQNDEGEQVVVVDYTYYNDGFVSSLGSGLVIGAPSQMKIYDKNGSVGSTYVCFEDKTPAAVPVGKNCNATQAFILPSASETMDLELDVILNGKHNKATVKLTLSKPIDIIKDYWIKNGESSDAGYYIAAESNENVKVIYDPEKQQLIFTENGTTGNMDSEVSIYYDIANKIVTNVNFECVNYPMDYSYSAVAGMNALAYKYGDTLEFITTSGPLPEYVSESELKNTANIALKTLMTGVELIFAENTNYSLSDIGFSSFEIEL